MKLAKRIDDLETQQRQRAGYWVRLKCDSTLGQSTEGVIADYEARHGVDPDRNFLVWNVVYPKRALLCA